MPNSGSPGTAATFERWFPRVHKTALGCAVGVTTGTALFLLTALHLLVFGWEGLPIGLLTQYLFLYDVDWLGAFVGLAWGFALGFVAGWLLAFTHNLTVGVWLLLVRTRADLSQKRNVLDHIR